MPSRRFASMPQWQCAARRDECNTCAMAIRTTFTKDPWVGKDTHILIEELGVVPDEWNIPGGKRQNGGVSGKCLQTGTRSQNFLMRKFGWPVHRRTAADHVPLSIHQSSYSINIPESYDGPMRLKRKKETCINFPRISEFMKDADYSHKPANDRVLSSH